MFIKYLMILFTAATLNLKAMELETPTANINKEPESLLNICAKTITVKLINDTIQGKILLRLNNSEQLPKNPHKLLKANLDALQLPEEMNELLKDILNKYYGNVLKILKKAHSINKRGNYNVTLLMCALAEKNLDIVKLFLTPETIDAQANDGATALILATKKSLVDHVKILLQANAKLDIQDQHDNTALILAAKNNNVEIAKLLLEHNANPFISNNEDKTALAIAQENQNQELENLLKEYILSYFTLTCLSNELDNNNSKPASSSDLQIGIEINDYMTIENAAQAENIDNHDYIDQITAQENETDDAIETEIDPVLIEDSNTNPPREKKRMHENQLEGPKKKSKTNRHAKNKNFTCEDCGKAFTQKGGLTIHKRIHTGEKPFVCNFCHRSFFQKVQLNNHIMIHTGERPFACNYESCTKKFITKYDLNAHTKRHGEKTFACNYIGCTKKFFTQHDLNIHTKRHAEKTFACNYIGCTKKFITNTELKLHTKRRHTGERPFACNYQGCTRKFFTNTELNYHTKKCPAKEHLLVITRK